MTKAEARQALVDALAALPELSVTAAQPATIVAGSAWPAWASSSWRNACVIQTEWAVFVGLANGSAEATVADGDAMEELVAPVLFPIGKVTRDEAWQIPVESGQQAVPVLRFTIEI